MEDRPKSGAFFYEKITIDNKYYAAYSIIQKEV